MGSEGSANSNISLILGDVRSHPVNKENQYSDTHGEQDLTEKCIFYMVVHEGSARL